MKDRLNTIVEKLNPYDQLWFADHGIVVRKKDDYWVLNYGQQAPKNEYNVLTRGLVIKKDKIISCPFFRFFNYGEKEAAPVNFANADILEKLDGSLVGVCFPDGDVTKPVWHFRNLLSAHQQDRDFAIKGFVLNEEYPLLMEVKPYLDQVNFTMFKDDLDLKNTSFTFEFISRVNQVITYYTPEQYGLYLIGCRNLETLEEKSEYDLDCMSIFLNVKRPRIFAANSYDQVVAMMANHPKDYEGFVVRDRETGSRIKIKSEDYLKRHRLLTKLNYRNLIPLWIAGEKGEIEATMPQTKQIFDEIEKCYNDFVEKCMNVLTYWQNKNVSRKEVALGIVGKEPKEVCGVVFKLIDTQKDQLRAVEKTVQAIRVDALITAWHLKDDVVEHVVDEVMA